MLFGGQEPTEAGSVTSGEELLGLVLSGCAGYRARVA
jgi:hypothetical protein